MRTNDGDNEDDEDDDDDIQTLIDDPMPQIINLNGLDKILCRLIIRNEMHWMMFIMFINDKHLFFK